MFNTRFLLIRQVKTLRDLPVLFTVTSEEKNYYIDGDFYVFMQYCLKVIPEDALVLFKVVPNEPALYSRLWYYKEYLVQKTPYYLFPRQIIRWENYNPANPANKSNFIITFDTQTQSLSLDKT
jgi:hypothetical protein